LPAKNDYKYPSPVIISGSDFTIKDHKIMEAERINALSALLADLTTREAELRRYL
jgi:hypothetical protein